MNRQILIALLLAVTAAAMTYYYISEKEAAIKADVTPIYVLVAKKPIPRGSELIREKVSVDEIPGAYVMPGAVSSRNREGIRKLWEKYKSQYAVVDIAKGEQILPNKLSSIIPGFASAVQEGQRIVAFSFKPASAVGGHLKPGNRVDVIGTFEHQYRKTKRTTSVVMVQNVLVAAVGNATTLGNDGPKKKSSSLGGPGALVVSLAVQPEDATRLSLAEQEGSLKLALRALGDDKEVDLRDQNLGTVLGPLMKVKREEIKPAKKRVKIIHGM